METKTIVIVAGVIALLWWLNKKKPTTGSQESQGAGTNDMPSGSGMPMMGGGMQGSIPSTPTPTSAGSGTGGSGSGNLGIGQIVAQPSIIVPKVAVASKSTVGTAIGGATSTAKTIPSSSGMLGADGYYK